MNKKTESSAQVTNETVAQSPRKRVAKGRRPYFMSDPDVDRLLAMIMALTGELSVLRERLDTHERLLDQSQVMRIDDIEGFAPDKAVESQREAERQASLSRVFRILEVSEEAGDVDLLENHDDS